ncbi:MAG TPA: response regulator transcription factor [Candidatus Marinimicrobia bacterium]|nr:response regulator transcription factor [Candidatus Neomarinimicrobiota bacterium]
MEQFQKHILIVDDEEDILELVKYNLGINGFLTTCATNGEEALKFTRLHKPDLIVLDLMLPNIDGLDVCRVLKADSETKSIPILMLTARGEESDIIQGLEMGADDYVTKPFSPQVLVARVKTLLRRYSEPIEDKEGVIRIRELSIHPGRREVKIGEKRVELTYTEFQILHLLARHQNFVFTRNQIIDEIRGENYPVTDRTVDFQIVGLRKKLDQAGKYIKTVRGVGYRFYLED